MFKSETSISFNEATSRPDAFYRQRRRMSTVSGRRRA